MIALSLAALLAAEPAGTEAPPPAPADAPVVEAPAAGPADGPVEPPAAAAASFIKGELSMYLGADRLVVKYNRVGVSAGLDRFGQAYYLLLEPHLDLRLLDSKLAVGLGAPLRLELFSFEAGPDGLPYLTHRLGQLRTEDWNSVHDFGRLLKYVTYGRKEDNLYFSAGQRYASSIGHGALMRRYAPNLDIDYVRASAELDAYNDYGGFELTTNDVLEWNQLAAIAFVKPLAFFHSGSLVAQTLSVGVSGGLDWKAPWELQVDPSTHLRLLDGDRRLKVTTRAVKLLGFDAEVKVVKTESVDLKPYVDYSMLLEGDSGLTLGVLGRFNLGRETVHAFRVVAELRFLGSRYQPGYFDTFYEVDRFTYADLPRVDPDRANSATKYRFTLDQGFGQRVGYYAEASWGVPGKVGVTLALEGVSNSPAKNLVAHLELPWFDFLQLFASYYKRGLVDFAELGRLDDKTVVFAGARLQILPVLFLNARAYKTFRMSPEVQRYDNQFGFLVDLEVGYEFGRKPALLPPPKLEEAPAPPPESPAEAPAPPPPPGEVSPGHDAPGR